MNALETQSTAESAGPRRVGIALGSNVGDRWDHLVRARAHILEISGVEPSCLCSPLYETEPVETEPDSAAFLNAVIEIGFAGTPQFLLQELQSLEVRMGRPRAHGFHTPRTIDLDILYAGTLSMSDPVLQIPHPRLAQRRFVLLPLYDIRPDLVLPGFAQSVSELLRDLQDPARAQLSEKQWKA